MLTCVVLGLATSYGTFPSHCGAIRDNSTSQFNRQVAKPITDVFSLVLV